MEQGHLPFPSIFFDTDSLGLDQGNLLIMLCDQYSHLRPEGQHGIRSEREGAQTSLNNCARSASVTSIR